MTHRRHGRTAAQVASVAILGVLMGWPAACSGGSSKSKRQGSTLPSITSIAPSVGSPSGGESVFIVTVSFTDDFLVNPPTVTFGATAALSVTAASSKAVNVVTPPGAIGLVDVTLTTTGVVESDTVPGGFRYTCGTPVACTISGACPDQGSPNGGDVVTITGTGFVATPEVLFGTIPATSVTVVSPTEIEAVSPPVVVGGNTVDIVIDHCSGATCTLAGAFRYRTVDPMVDFDDMAAPNDTLATCTTLPPLPLFMDRTIHGSADEDWYCLSTINPNGRLVEVLLAAAPINLELELFDSAGVFLQGSYQGAGVDEFLTTPGPGSYAVRVFGPCGQVGDYTLTTD